MNISYNWLRDLIDLDLSAEETAAALTRVGLAVEGIHRYGDDLVLDIDLTSNRPDCLSHLGVARELRVSTGKELMTETLRREDEVNEIPLPSVLAGEIVTIENPELCHRFTARIIRNVTIGPSPKWLVDRLEAVGERSINNVADITNYVMLELGQPMHAFDLDKLVENRIVVRTARTGEMITTLDEVERKVDESMLMICDSEKPVAIGGVMGGFDSSITEATTNVLLEVAYFKRDSVRATSRTLNLATEASYRFERGVDIDNLQRASDRAANLICDLTGGNLGEFIDVYPTPATRKTVQSPDLSVAVKRLTGLDVDDAECERILSSLGISRIGESAMFSVPSWRHDIAIEEDLVEEVARHVGYENILAELPPAFGAGEYQRTEPQEAAIRRTLVDHGFSEALNYSFIDAQHDGVYQNVPELVDERLEQPFVELRDSVIEGAIRMRPTLLPGLLVSVRLNFNYQQKNLQLFEIGKAFAASSGEDGLPTERELLALVVTGHELNENRSMPGRELDFYDAKGSIESALSAAGYTNVSFSADRVSHLRDGQTAAITVNGRPVGTLGRLNEEIAANYKFRQPVYVAEIDLQTVLEQTADAARYAPLPKFPSIVRDVSFTVNRDITFDLVREAALKAHIELCRAIRYVDLYEGRGLAENERSLTLRFEYRSDERTLLDAEVDEAHGAIIRQVEGSLNISQRI